MEIYKNFDLQDLDGEIWKDILDYEGDYQVSNIGRVKSFKLGKEIIRKQCKRGDYFCIVLWKYGKYKNKQVHTLVFESHSSYKLEQDECVHHINGDKENNIFDNLEKMPKSEHNSFHMKGENNSMFGKIGKNNPNYGNKRSEKERKTMSENHAYFKGENNPNHILTKKQIIQIKMLFKLNFKNKEISKLYNISSATISMIKNNKIWNHIKI
jgi:hypothetical protein